MTALARRLARIKPSTTLAVSARAGELRAAGVDVISFSAGEPDFDTPDHVCRAAVEALDRGMTRYTPVAGIPELRAAVAADSAAARGVPCTPDRVVVTVGAKHALYNLFQALLDEGDEVIVPSPYWVSYPDQVLLAGGEPVIVETTAAGGWLLDADAFARACTPRTKALVLNTPSNPTGGVYPRDELAALVAAATERGVYIISDEVYRELVYDGARHVSPLEVAPEEGRDKIAVVDGVSKTFAMTGWRIGWAIADPAIAAAVSKIQSQATSNATSVAQAAARAALEGPREFLADWVAQYARRRTRMVEGLAAMPGVECPDAAGAFYVLPSVNGVLERLGDTDDVQLATMLLDKAHVATVPGSAFGAPGHLRLSYATSMEAIEAGLERLGNALAAL